MDGWSLSFFPFSPPDVDDAIQSLPRGAARNCCPALTFKVGLCPIFILCNVIKSKKIRVQFRKIQFKKIFEKIRIPIYLRFLSPVYPQRREMHGRYRKRRSKRLCTIWLSCHRNLKRIAGR